MLHNIGQRLGSTTLRASPESITFDRFTRSAKGKFFFVFRLVTVNQQQEIGKIESQLTFYGGFRRGGRNLAAGVRRAPKRLPLPWPLLSLSPDEC